MSDIREEERASGAGDFDPVDLELAAGIFHSLAEEMGVSLVRSARSANIKERRDSSTALFDAAGGVVAQAEHIPVHLGALPASVRAVAAREQSPGDVWILNHPYWGGTHLPDVTMVAPVFVGGNLVAYVANRAHHADIGGAHGGSMAAGARELFAEGMIIPPIRIRVGGVERRDVSALILANCRRPGERQGDLRAQAAAVALGAERLAAIGGERGPGYLRSAMAEVRAYSIRRVRASLASLPPGRYCGEDALEGDGISAEPIPIRVEVQVEEDRLVFDLSASADEVEGNLNCPRAVSESACLFVARSLLDPTPLGSAGCAEVVQVRTRSGTVVDARFPRAVAGGNVETSQRIVDAVLDALGDPLDLPAASQGTMNNLVIAGAGFSYYETVAGGGGASRRAAGTDGIHSAMTNTWNTPVEALEKEFPFKVARYGFRGGSGGRGENRGGDGLVREIQVLAPCVMSLLAERHVKGAPGRAGGGPGAAGVCLINGESVGSKVVRALSPGDVITLKTPGGGGWGTASAG